PRARLRAPRRSTDRFPAGGGPGAPGRGGFGAPSVPLPGALPAGLRGRRVLRGGRSERRRTAVGPYAVGRRDLPRVTRPGPGAVGPDPVAGCDQSGSVAEPVHRRGLRGPRSRGPGGGQRSAVASRRTGPPCRCDHARLGVGPAPPCSHRGEEAPHRQPVGASFLTRLQRAKTSRPRETVSTGRSSLISGAVNGSAS